MEHAEANKVIREPEICSVRAYYTKLSRAPNRRPAGICKNNSQRFSFSYFVIFMYQHRPIIPRMMMTAAAIVGMITVHMQMLK